MKRFWLYLILFVFFAVNLNVYAQTSYPNEIAALKINSVIHLDGDLSESFWQQAPKISNFTQRELQEGKPVTERTETAIVYTQESLFIGIWCYDSEPDKLVAKEMARDFAYSRDDNFEIIVDTYHDKRNGYLFITNPNGARRDALVTDEGRGVNEDWNGVWDVAVQVTEKGWFAEIEIPFSTLKFPDGKQQIWGINFERNIRRKNEQVIWQGWSRDYELEMVSHAGTLVGIEGISGGHLLELKPYLAGGIQKINDDPWDKVGRIGGDINYLITSNYKLNVTLHPDFAQIESDRSQINLTRFSLYYPEKREFFLEGKDAFQFGLGSAGEVFYSRRIGIKEREEIPIIGGVRLLGKESGTEVGALSMQTAAKGSEKSTNYSVLRIKKDILGQSNIGVIATSKKSADTSNYVYGADFNYASSKFFGDKNIRFGSAVAISQSEQKSLNDKNLGYRVYLSMPNDFFEYDLSYYVVQNNFNPEVGFLRRKNYKHLYTELQFNPRPSFIPWIRQMEIKPLDIDYYWSDDTNKLESFFAEFRPLGFATKSGEFVEYNIMRFYDRLDEPFEIHDDVSIPVGDYLYTRHEIQFSTFSGRKLSAMGDASIGEYYTGDRLQSAIALMFNVNKHLNLSLDYEWNKLKFETHSFETHETGGKVDYAFNPKLYSSLYGQWNNEDKEILLNFRVNWIPKVGSDFYFAVNQIIDTNRAKWRFMDTVILSKFVFRFSQ